MSMRSLKASPEGIEKATRALTGKAWTQQDLADDITVDRQTVNKFFRGGAIDRKTFVEICKKLDLSWEEITSEAKPPNFVDSSAEANVNVDINALVQQVREKIKPLIQERCGTMRVLDMNQPIGLNDIYTNVNILEKITGRTRRTIDELLKNSNTESGDFDRFGLNRVTEKSVSGLKAVESRSKLMVLGKPGAGKTTFLKFLAMQCISGLFQQNRVPIFITLKHFAETQDKPDLREFIVQQLGHNLITNPSISDLLSRGSFLVLLDGLDEVKEEDNTRVINQIKEFSEQYHNNQFVITCRIAAREYTYEKFTEVEVADFGEEQIETFVTKWFQQKNDKDTPRRFMQQLESNQPIKELANNPLLLTLLCLEFEDSGDFPPSRAELYNRAIHTLLRKWDTKRGIVRDEVYKNLSVKYKEDLLSQLGWATFERSEYFFKQTNIEEYIADYIRNLPEAKNNTKALPLDSEPVLKSIEAQHGLLVERAKSIYSFSHLTFHEYFTAREIKERSAWARLAEHVTQKRWREVFLLTFGMVRSADDLLKSMKQQIDALLAGDEKLQKFLAWVKEKSDSVEVPYKPAAVRAFYLDRALDRALDLDLALARDLDLALALALERVLDLNRDLARARARALDLDLARALDRALARARDLYPELERSLQQLNDQLPNRNDEGAFEQWFFENCEAWTEQLRSVMIEHRNIGHDWQFSKEQKDLLKQYYDANKLLVDCLNSDCYVSREVRQEIEKTLLLPVKQN